MADIKISQLTAKGATIASTDLIEISESNGAGGYITKSVTGANIIGSKQQTLVSGTNIKTLNSNSILGSGDLAVQPTLISGTNIKTIEGQSILGGGNINITNTDVGLGNVDNTSDLNKPISTATQTALNAKQNTITNSDSITEGVTNLFLTSAERTKLVNTSGTNTGDQTNITGTADNVTGIVAVANGGTGTATPSLVAGTNVTITGTFPNQTINASGGGGGGGGAGIHAPTTLKTGGFYSSCLNAQARVSSGFPVDTIILYPFIPMQTITTSGFLYTNNTAVAGGLARILVYGTLNGLPSNKLYESADINSSTTGDKTVNSSQTFIAGTTYWLAYAINNLSQNVQCFPLSSIASIGGNYTNIFTQNSNLRYAATLGAAPATLNQALFGLNSGNIPSIFLIAT